MTELRTNGSVVNGLGQQHIDNISGFVTDAPDLSGLLNSHGVIGNPTDFGGAYEARANAMKATKAASEKMSDLLSQAAAAYDRGDVEAARKLKAQADQIEGKGGPGSPSAGGPGGQDGGSQAAGQIMGQFSQLAGQVVQGVTQPVQGIMQGVSQMPQQVFQGVQGIVQTATQAGSGATDAAAKAAASGPSAPAGAGAPAGPGAPAGQGAQPGAGAPSGGEKAPAGIMSEERMREIQGLPIHPEGTDRMTDNSKSERDL